MELKAKIIKGSSTFYEYVTEPKRVKRCTIAGLVSLVVFLLIAVFFANFFDPAQYNVYKINNEIQPWNGYNIFDHYISDLGSVLYTPIPVLLNILWMAESILFTPLVFYLYKRARMVYNEKQKRPIDKIVMQILIYFGFVFLVVGIFGWFFVGFFSEDEGRLLAAFGIKILGLNFHMFFSLVVFGGFVLAGIFIGLFFIFYPKTIVERFGVKIPWVLIVIVGLEMLIWPPIHTIGFTFSWLPSKPFHEWFMLFALLVWLYPVGIYTIKMLNIELAER